MQYRAYNRINMQYVDGGYVGDFSIDDDYINQNNGYANIAEETTANAGDIFCLIETSGAYFKGVVTSVDNADRKIYFRAGKEIFNDNVFNPLLSEFKEDTDVKIAGMFGVNDVADMIDTYWGRCVDRYKKLPMRITTDGEVYVMDELIAGETFDALRFNTEMTVDEVCDILSGLEYDISYGNTGTADLINANGIRVYAYKDGANRYKILVNFTDVFSSYGSTIGWQNLLGNTIEYSEEHEINTVNNAAGWNNILIGKRSVGMTWTWKNVSINFVDWLIELFEKYSVVVNWDIDFDTPAGAVQYRSPKYNVVVRAVSDKNGMIKDNVAMQTITYQKEELPSKTVCCVIDKNTGTLCNVDLTRKNLLDRTFGYDMSYVDAAKGKVYKVEYLATNQSTISEAGQESVVTNYIPLESGAYYLLSMSNAIDGYRRNICFYDSNKQHKGSVVIDDQYGYVASSQTGNITVNFRMPANATKCLVCYPRNATRVQLEKVANASVTQPTAYSPYDTKAILYLCVRDGVYYVDVNPSNTERVLPVKTSYIEYDADNASVTVLEAAKNELVPNTYNQAIEITIPKDSMMFDFENARFGDVYRIITKNGTITSVYSGRKETSTSKLVTLLFGYGRKNYTDLIQKQLRGRRYDALYGSK